MAPSGIRRSACRVFIAAAAMMAAMTAGQASPWSDNGPPGHLSAVLRVCADPNNMPFSDKKGEGFENKLAEMAAKALGEKLVYFWWAERRGFVRSTLNAGKCDVVMGTPNLGMLATTRPYYRSSFVFVTRKDRNLTFSSMQAPELKHLQIGVHLIGDDGFNTPPAQALGLQHIVDNVRGYMIYGDYRKASPPSRLIEAVERGDVDVAAAWGPLAGYFARKSPVPLRIVPITDTMRYLPILFSYPISMGVRRSEDGLKDQLDQVIFSNRKDIKALLDSYGIPQT